MFLDNGSFFTNIYVNLISRKKILNLGGLRQILQQPQQQQFQQQRMPGGMMPMNQQMGGPQGPRAPQQGDSLRNMLN